MHTLQIIISRTDTMVGKTIRMFTHEKLNHCAIALDKDYDRVYSFTRRYEHFFFTGCFCTEPLERYADYEIAEVVLSDKEYLRIKKFLSALNKKFRIYDFPGIIFTGFQIKHYQPKYHYICSTFAAKILDLTDSVRLKKDVNLYKPMDVHDLIKNKIIVKAKILNK